MITKTDFSKFRVVKRQSGKGLLHLAKPGESVTLCGKEAGDVSSDKFSLAQCIRCYHRSFHQGGNL